MIVAIAISDINVGSKRGFLGSRELRLINFWMREVDRVPAFGALLVPLWVWTSQGVTAPLGSGSPSAAQRNERVFPRTSGDLGVRAGGFHGSA